MFEARLVDGVILRQVMDAIKDLVRDANIEATEEDLQIQCMDAAHVSLVDVRLGSAAFDQYRCDKALKLGFNSENMTKIMKMLNKDDAVILKAEDEGDKLTIMFEDPDSKTIADFDLNLMEIDAEQLTIPDAQYSCSVRMPSREFQRIVRDLQVFGDTCTIRISKEGIRFGVSGAIGSGNVLLRANAATEREEDRVVIDMEEPAELSFALRYLNFFTKATPLSGVVNLSMSAEMPIVVDYPIGDSGHVRFFLAPKLDEDDEMEGGDE